MKNSNETFGVIFKQCKWIGIFLGLFWLKRERKVDHRRKVYEALGIEKWRASINGYFLVSKDGILLYHFLCKLSKIDLSSRFPIFAFYIYQWPHSSLFFRTFTISKKWIVQSWIKLKKKSSSFKMAFAAARMIKEKAKRPSMDLALYPVSNIFMVSMT